eukprot:TRINITY_DN4806_c0_g1_i1.p1 TRINITY_DN4806_c0_g1~~TRINITY_DN4806_c0_g1_i1.p1  ORF type:complete len:217 (-),score=28.14 TRINITY_DN4806_c0_g1_i1:120-770(-)
MRNSSILFLGILAISLAYADVRSIIQSAFGPNFPTDWSAQMVITEIAPPIPNQQSITNVLVTPSVFGTEFVKQPGIQSGFNVEFKGNSTAYTYLVLVGGFSTCSCNKFKRTDEPKLTGFTNTGKPCNYNSASGTIYLNSTIYYNPSLPNSSTNTTIKFCYGSRPIFFDVEADTTNSGKKISTFTKGYFNSYTSPASPQLVNKLRLPPKCLNLECRK